mmetsp:Transcript_25561/g.54306  ORF Transcript_25561/g.54306 Transcript_25561/m.54306 type:complete len:308 (+) Transcript_25561:3515-4438(+)
MVGEVETDGDAVGPMEDVGEWEMEGFNVGLEVGLLVGVLASTGDWEGDPGRTVGLGVSSGDTPLGLGDGLFVGVPASMGDGGGDTGGTVGLGVGSGVAPSGLGVGLLVGEPGCGLTSTVVGGFVFTGTCEGDPFGTVGKGVIGGRTGPPFPRGDWEGEPFAKLGLGVNLGVGFSVGVPPGMGLESTAVGGGVGRFEGCGVGSGVRRGVGLFDGFDVGRSVGIMVVGSSVGVMVGGATSSAPTFSRLSPIVPHTYVRYCLSCLVGLSPSPVPDVRIPVMSTSESPFSQQPFPPHGWLGYSSHRQERTR